MEYTNENRIQNNQIKIQKHFSLKMVYRVRIEIFFTSPLTGHYKSLDAKCI